MSSLEGEEGEGEVITGYGCLGKHRLRNAMIALDFTWGQLLLRCADKCHIMRDWFLSLDAYKFNWE